MQHQKMNVQAFAHKFDTHKAKKIYFEKMNVLEIVRLHTSENTLTKLNFLHPAICNWPFNYEINNWKENLCNKYL